MATTTEDLQATTPVVTLTPEAHKVVREAIGQEPDPASLALWLEVRGVQAGSFVYDLYFQAVSDADEGDARHAQEELEIVIPRQASSGSAAPASSGPRREGAASSWSTRTRRRPRRPLRASRPRCWPRGSPGRWPNASSPSWSRPSTPSIASHGGRADLVALNEEDGTAYLGSPVGARAAPCRR